MASFGWLITLFIIVLANYSSLSTGRVLYVTPTHNERCPGEPCLTFSEYVNRSEQYFTSNATFIFLSGNHLLNERLRIVNVSNITLRGETSSSDELVAQINCAPFVNLTFINTTSIEIASLWFVLCGYSVESTLSFSMSTQIQITDVSFFGDASIVSRALLIFMSDVSITNSYFTGTSSSFGGAVYISESTVTCSDNVFIGNRAQIGGGAIFAITSTVTFSGKNTFSENSALSFSVIPYGGAILSFTSSLEFNGTTTFVRNNVTTSEYIAANSQPVGGAISATGSLSFHGNVSFIENTAPTTGALHVENARIEIHGTATFNGNTATHADAGAFQVSSNSFLSSDANMLFCNNSANQFGGALRIAGSQVSVEGLTFQNNHANYGGALSIFFATSANISKSTFKNNTAVSFGGAIRIDNSTVFIEGTHYSNNRAFFGGAIDTIYTNVSFTGTNIFERNSVQANGGALEGVYSSMVFSGIISFVKNRANQGGGIYIGGNCDFRFANSTEFSGNTADQGGGIYAVDSILQLSDNQMFERNLAREGGAFALGGSLRLILAAPLQLKALLNQASTYGGVIFFADSSSIIQCLPPEQPQVSQPPPPPPDCFLEVEGEILSDGEIRLSFVNNSATLSGTVLYGGRLDMCRLPVHRGSQASVQYIDNAIEAFNTLSTYVTDDEITSNISSDPLRVCFCQNGAPNCSLDQHMSVVRGELFFFSAVTVGQNNNTVPSSIRVDVDNNAELGLLQRIQPTGQTCTDISYRLFTPDSSENLVLYPDGPCRDTGFARRIVQVTLLDCPDGFNLSGASCVCDERLLPFTTTCNVDDDSIERMGAFWISPSLDNGTYLGLIIYPRCPFDYCVTEAVNVTLNNPDLQCAYNRTGILCGSCASNLSLALGSSRCLACSNFYLLLLLPFALAGIVLVLLLLVCRLTVSVGTLNGLILYANIIQINRKIFLPPEDINVLTVFIAWINLDLGIETCFYDGLNAYVYTWLQFLFPFYLWVLLGLIILICRFSLKATKIVGAGNPVPVFATLLLMSYSKILRTIIIGLSYSRLQFPPDGSLVSVWQFDGNIPYFHGVQHISLAVFTLITLLFLFLPYTILLLVGHRLLAFSDRKGFQWMNRIKPILDAYYGPYRKENRYWTGFLLLVRCALFLTFAFNALDSVSVNLLAITSVFSGIAVVAWLSGRIYEKLYLDILEASYIFNLCIFAVATYHVNAVGGNQAALAYTSVGIAFMTFLGTLLVHVYLQLKESLVWKVWCKPKFIQLVPTAFREDADDHEELVVTSEDMVPVHASNWTHTSVGLRESLLDN